jgi:Zn-dependent peptidase ImmA (M78 family)
LIRQMRRKHRWHSEFAKNLQENQATSSVEEAVIKLVRNKLKPLRLSPPADLQMVASACNIIPKFELIAMEQDGRLIFRDNKYYIQVNISQGSRRQRFSIAHEITHKILDLNSTVRYKACTGVGHFVEREEEEWLCDFGAKCILLLDGDHLAPIMNDLGFNSQAVEKVFFEFDVSFEVAVRALVEISFQEIAAVFLVWGYRSSEEAQSRNFTLWSDIEKPQPKLRIIRSYASRSFPFGLLNNKSIDIESRVYEAFDAQTCLQLNEVHSFDKSGKYQVDIEAIPRTIYVKGQRKEGIVLLLANPIKLN